MRALFIAGAATINSGTIYAFGRVFWWTKLRTFREASRLRSSSRYSNDKLEVVTSRSERKIYINSAEGDLAVGQGEKFTRESLLRIGERLNTDVPASNRACFPGLPSTPRREPLRFSFFSRSLIFCTNVGEARVRISSESELPRLRGTRAIRDRGLSVSMLNPELTRLNRSTHAASFNLLPTLRRAEVNTCKRSLEKNPVLLDRARYSVQVIAWLSTTALFRNASIFADGAHN